MGKGRLLGPSAVAAFAALALAAASAPAATAVAYSFSGRLLTTPLPAANSLSLDVKTGNAEALAKLGRESPSQAFAVSSSTVYYKWSKGVRSTASIRDLRAGHWVAIEVRAADTATLAQIKATAARTVQTYGVWDTTAPAITPAVSGTAGSAGWYRTDVTVGWAVADAESGVVSSAGCDSVSVTQETGGVTLTCSARNRVALTGSASVTIRLDKTAPAVTATPTRAPDTNGIYNHPVDVAAAATDATSGVEGCTGATYGGPDGTGLQVSVSCVDRAGNSATASIALNYDATPPAAVSGLRAEAGDHRVVLRWRRPLDADFDRVLVLRSGALERAALASERAIYEGVEPVFRDRRLRNDVHFRYSVIALDKAGNRSAPASVTALPRAALLVSPRLNARVSRPPLLRWAPYRSPRYYNVQLFRGGRKILSAWPGRARLHLTRSWRFGGRRYRLVPGIYRWYVWPGYGSRKHARYGRLIGKSTFVVRR